MKKIIAAIICLFAIQLSAQADDKRIQYNQLPSNARQFIEQHYTSAQVQEVIEDDEWMGFDKSYEVRFNNGDKIEFNSNGEWEDLKMKNGSVPDHLVPAQIKDYVNQNHKGAKVTRVDKGYRKYKVNLDNGQELIFDKNYKFRGYDD